MYLVCYEKADGDDLMFEPIFREAPQQTPIVSPIFGRGICRPYLRQLYYPRVLVLRLNGAVLSLLQNIPTGTRINNPGESQSWSPIRRKASCTGPSLLNPPTDLPNNGAMEIHVQISFMQMHTVGFMRNWTALKFRARLR